MMREEKSKRPVISIVIMVLLVVLYIADAFLLALDNINVFSRANLLYGEQGSALRDLLTLNTADIFQGQVWRAASYMFLHAGLLQLLLSLLLLFVLGMTLEKMVGKAKFLLTYLFSGTFSAICMMRVYAIEGGMGASAALHGLVALIVVLLLQDGRELGKRMSIFRWIVLAGMLLANILWAPSVLVGNFAGFVGGIIIAVILVATSAQKSLLPNRGYYRF